MKSFLRSIISENLDPWHVFAAVFTGVFIGVVPIYGLQSLTAIGLAIALRLNKPITLGATLINNPLLQPFIILYSVQLGHYLLHGEVLHLGSFHIANIDIRSRLYDWVLGSLVLGFILGIACASLAALLAYSHSHHKAGEKINARAAARFVKEVFQLSPFSARQFVRWKLRLDRAFELLLTQMDFRTSAVDLGCGYGIALSIAAFRNPGLRLVGCDLDEKRIRIGCRALSRFNAELFNHDVRTFEFTQADLVLIMDVLQYLDPLEQELLLKRCCVALEPLGRLIFRVPDRERGLLSTFTSALDKIVFHFTYKRKKPVVLCPGEYEKILTDADMIVQKRRMIGRLPLAHIVFIAEKPGKPGERENSEGLLSHARQVR